MRNSELTVGVIGGLGPGACVDFLARVVEVTPASRDQQHVHLIVDQNPKIPSRQDAIMRDGVSPGPELAAMAVGLEAAGCDFIVMPCNTAHAYRDEIIAALRIPFVSIIDACMNALPKNVTGVGLMATPACLKTRLYQSAIKEIGKTCIEHGAAEVEQLMNLTYEIKRGDTGPQIATSMLSLAETLVSRGAEVIIVACTEIPLVLSNDSVAVPVVSSTQELAKTTVGLARGELSLRGHNKGSRQ